MSSMPEGMADQQNADAQNANQQNADQGGGGTSPTSTPSPEDTIMYCTLPFQISVNQLGIGAVTRIDWKQFQTAPQLLLTLQDAGGLPINLTGATVTLRLMPLSGGDPIVAQAMTLAYAAGGLVSYHFQAKDVATAGQFLLEVEAVMGNGDTLYFPTSNKLLFVINKALGGP